MGDTNEVPDEIDTDEGAELVVRRPWWKRTLVVLAIATAALVALGLLLYNFGGMMPPTAEAKSQYAQLESMGAVEPIAHRLHIPIPGCVCHSDDPVLQLQHAERSLKQCAGCHSGRGIATAR
jgi:hypothetical protein